MGLYICAKCDCIENTALGHYWSRTSIKLYKWDKSNVKYKGDALCSECAPVEFRDGTLTGWGKWHGKFEKRTKYNNEDIY